MFHDAKFVKMHPKRCCQLITKLLYLLAQGETLGGSEASEVFFGVTKLFQSTDVRDGRSRGGFERCTLFKSSVLLLLFLLAFRATFAVWCTCF